MILYLLLDLVFGFSAKIMLKNCKNFNKAAKSWPLLSEIDRDFKILQKKFGLKRAK